MTMVTRRFIDRSRSIELDRYNSKFQIEQVFQSLVICGLCRGHGSTAASNQWILIRGRYVLRLAWRL